MASSATATSYGLASARSLELLLLLWNLRARITSAQDCMACSRADQLLELRQHAKARRSRVSTGLADEVERQLALVDVVRAVAKQRGDRATYLAIVVLEVCQDVLDELAGRALRLLQECADGVRARDLAAVGEEECWVNLLLDHVVDALQRVARQAAAFTRTPTVDAQGECGRGKQPCDEQRCNTEPHGWKNEESKGRAGRKEQATGSRRRESSDTTMRSCTCPLPNARRSASHRPLAPASDQCNHASGSKGPPRLPRALMMQISNSSPRAVAVSVPNFQSLRRTRAPP